MKNISIWGTILFFALGTALALAADFETDILKTSLGDLEMTFIGHGTLMFSLGGTVMQNGDVKTFGELKIEAVPAYNLDPETQFHPKGRDNGYVLTAGDHRIYIAGDTESIPEMKSLKDIDVAFLPMNRPFTMTPEMAAEAARAFKPRFLYPYHYGSTDPQELVALLRDLPEVEVRIRNLR